MTRENGVFAPIDEPNLQREIFAGKSIVVFVYADWCLPCRDMKNILHNHSEEISRALDAKKVEGRYMLNSDSTRELQKKYNILAIPASLAFSEGTHRGTLQGTKAPIHYINWLKTSFP